MSADGAVRAVDDPMVRAKIAGFNARYGYSVRPNSLAP